jgi:hypothetical protein
MTYLKLPPQHQSLMTQLQQDHHLSQELLHEASQICESYGEDF